MDSIGLPPHTPLVYDCTVAVAALVVAIVSALAAIGAVVYAALLDRRASEVVAAARDSAAASARSAVASEKRLAVDTNRRESELTPRFRLTLQPENEGGTWRLDVLLLGPHELKRLDGLAVRIRDDHPWRSQWSVEFGLTSEPTKEIWGPLQLLPGSPGVTNVPGVSTDPIGRVKQTAGMPVGEILSFLLVGTEPPSWSDWPIDMWKRMRGTKLRLELEAQREGLELWTLPCEIDASEPTPVQIP